MVKLRLCPACSEKLNYRSKKREIKRLKKNQKCKTLKEGSSIGSITSNSSFKSHQVSNKIDESTSTLADYCNKKSETKINEPVVGDKEHWSKGKLLYILSLILILTFFILNILQKLTLKILYLEKKNLMVIWRTFFYKVLNPFCKTHNLNEYFMFFIINILF